MVNNNCRNLHNDPFMTPNNYDLQFEIDKIPSNIQIENQNNLEKRLQKLMPLSKIIHVNLSLVSTPQNNALSLFSKLVLKDTSGNILKEVEFL